MSEQTVVPAESSTATFELPQSGTREYAEWRMTGELPEKEEAPKPKTAESATADATEETSTSDAGASEAPSKKQENPGHRKPGAEQRISQLTAENKRIKAELDALKSGKQTASAAKPAETTTPAKTPPQPFTRPKPTVDAKKADGTPMYATYEEFTEDLADWKAEQRIVGMERQRQAQEQQKALQSELEKAQARYGANIYEETIKPAGNAIMSKTQGVVRQMVNDSPVLSHLLYTIGSDPEDLAAFIEMANSNPRKAIKYLAETERLIEEELEKETTTQAAAAAVPERKPNGQFVPKSESTAPAKRGPESAAPPPLEVGGRGAGPKDESTRALSAIANGDSRAFRDYMRAENAKEMRRRRGA